MKIAFCHGWLSTTHALFVGMKCLLMMLITTKHAPRRNQTLLPLLTQGTLNLRVMLKEPLVGSHSGVRLCHMLPGKFPNMELRGVQELEHVGLLYQDLHQDQLQVLVEEPDGFQSSFPGLFVHLLLHQLLPPVGKQKPQHQVHMVHLQEEAPISPQEVE
jgi:hypothetical protein